MPILLAQPRMKLNARISSERASRTVSKSGDVEIVIDLQRKNTTFGRVVMRYEEPNGMRCYFYPLTEVIGRGGRILLHEVKT